MIDELARHEGDPRELLAELARQLASAGRWHELFEARLVEARHRLGLPSHLAQPLDELPEPARTRLEAAYTEACSEVGQLLLSAERYRDAWRYLRAAGEQPLLRAALERVTPRGDSVDELIEVALYEGADPQRGFAWLLGHQGVCNAVTTLDGIAHSLPPADLAVCAAALVRRVHKDLVENLRSAISERGEQAPATTNIERLLADRPWLFEGDNYHIDTSHLAATVRLARVITVPADNELAAQLAHYGKHLAADLQYASAPPFDDGYAAYELFYAAQVGRNIDTAIAYFTKLADANTIDSDGPAATETLIVLLDRVGRAGDALREFIARVPRQARLSGFAPTVLSLAQRSGDWQSYDELTVRNDDPVAWAMGRLARTKS